MRWVGSAVLVHAPSSSRDIVKIKKKVVLEGECKVFWRGGGRDTMLQTCCACNCLRASPVGLGGVSDLHVCLMWRFKAMGLSLYLQYT